MSQCLCDRCSALCCRYFSLGIDTPETPEDFDNLRWYLSHEAVHIFVEDGDWYLSVQTPCKHLQADNRCGIYEDRPKICRQYSTDNCDYHVGSYDYEHYFTTPQQLEAYAQSALGKRYAKYVLKQRLKNTGISRDDPRRPKTKHVLESRIHPMIKAHLRRRPSRDVQPSDSCTSVCPASRASGRSHPSGGSGGRGGKWVTLSIRATDASLRHPSSLRT